MKKALFVVTAASTALVLAGSAMAGSEDSKNQKGHGHELHWSYGGAGGPDQWGNLKSEFSACKGTQQSPINIQTQEALGATLTKIKFDWKDSALNIKNNGHTIQANYDGGSSIEVNGGKFNLLQYHFHTPSEHALNGKLYDMEVHFVHKAADGALAVVGVFFKEGAENKALSTVWNNMPTTEGEKKVSGVTISAQDLLPANTSKYYHYMGSLTTPPCNEVVNWYVLENPIEASKAQVKALADLFTVNNRPVQPLNRRFVLTSEE